MKTLILVAPLAMAALAYGSGQSREVLERVQEASVRVAAVSESVAAVSQIAALRFAGAAERAEREQERAEREQERAERAQERVERYYERGSEALEKRQWEEAVSAFSDVPRTSARADGALYWTAYAQNKLGRRDQALATLAELEKNFPQSRWLNDAKALRIEIRQAQGQPVRPEAQDDEDLKLMAINSLMHTDNERAVPMLAQVLQSSASPRLKERALFVLAQSGSPAARQAIVDMAKGKANPDLQRKAITYLGLFGGSDSSAALADIYRSSQDPVVRKQVIESWFLKGDTQRMAELARTEKDPAVRREAITKLGLMGKKTAPDLAAMYGTETDKQLKKAILNAFFLQGNATSIIELARKETDPELKREAVSKLSIMGSKEASDFMMEILNK